MLFEDSMAAMDNESSKRGKLVDVIILSAVLVFIAVGVLVVAINWGTWDPDRENWDSRIPDSPSADKTPPADATNE